MKGWKHPFNVDTFRTLGEARRAYPHVTTFERVTLGEMVRHPTAGLVHKYSRVRRLHYDPRNEGKPVCGARGRRLRRTGKPSVVTCTSCLRSIGKKQRDGETDLFGDPT